MFNIKRKFNKAIILIIALLFTAIILSCIPEICSDNISWTVSNTPNSSISQLEQELITLINDYRTDNGVSILIIDTQQTVSAQRHANDMANRNYFNEITLSCGWNFTDRAEISDAIVDDEIYQQNRTTAHDTFDAFTNNITTDDIILGDYSSIGIGEKEEYWVVNFD